MVAGRPAGCSSRAVRCLGVVHELAGAVWSAAAAAVGLEEQAPCSCDRTA